MATKKAKVCNAAVEIYNAKDGWRWRLRHANGKIIAESGEAYAQKAMCGRMWRKSGVYLNQLMTATPDD